MQNAGIQINQRKMRTLENMRPGFQNQKDESSDAELEPGAPWGLSHNAIGVVLFWPQDEPHQFAQGP